MIFFRNFRERMKLLEFENEILAKKIQELEKYTNFQPKPRIPHTRIIKDYTWDLSYDTLRKRHRNHKVKYNDGL